MNINKTNQFLSWISIFILAWMLVLNVLPINSTSIVFLAIFLSIAVLSGVSVIAEENEKKKNAQIMSIRKIDKDES